jgi:hypothetical protein
MWLHQWQIELFAKREGMVMLPRFSLQLEGKSMARKTVSLPSLSIRVLPLPFYLPKEVLVGKSITLVAQHQVLPTLGLVGDMLNRQLVIETQAVQPNTLVLPALSGQSIQGLSPVWQVLDNRIQMTQAWQIQASGSWRVDDQHLWLFDPDTLKTTHLIIEGAQGIAMPIWLWRIIQVSLALMMVALLGWCYVLVMQRIKAYRYRKGILACQDAHQLIQYLRRHYGYADGVVLSHKIAPHHPDYTSIVELEGMLFGQTPLYGRLFHTLKQKVADHAHESSH